MKQLSKGRMTAYSLLMVMVALAATLLAGALQDRNRSWDFGAWTETDVVSAQAEYQQEPDNDHLARLLKGLCWQYKVRGDESVISQLQALGQELLDRARNETADLEQMDGDGVLSQALAVIREVGAR